MLSIHQNFQVHQKQEIVTTKSYLRRYDDLGNVENLVSQFGVPDGNPQTEKGSR